MQERCCESTRSGLRRVVTGAVIALVIAAVVEQLRRPPQERTWRGRLAGFIPYNFRMPTMAELRETYWNPMNRNLMTGKAFGLGWTFNFYQIYRMLRSALATR